MALTPGEVGFWLPDEQTLLLASGGMLHMSGGGGIAVPDEDALEREADETTEAVNSLKEKTGRTDFEWAEVVDESNRLKAERG